MPASTFIGDALTPLPDMPDPASGGNAAFAVQDNIIEGGVIVALYLHHLVADIERMASIIRHMSTKTFSKLVLTPFRHYNRTRNISRREMINERLQHQDSSSGVHLSAFNCLTAILWKVIAKACWPSGTIEGGQVTAHLHAVSIRNRIDPPLDNNFRGYACLFSHCTSTVLRLGLPLDISTAKDAAHLVRSGIANLTEPKVRSAITLINSRDAVRSVNHTRIDCNNDVLITSWADLPVGEEADLDLAWTRQSSEGRLADMTRRTTATCFLCRRKRVSGKFLSS
ncbi:hypothetical protein DOTSEDRAFT_20007 [Dothistroma septosporum NZE10]|uniref:Uncharacterized protein n=1 Tax=Dothistroma septosporum (strain NZE10 / CBS 128990) TaxID=675120 RepID=N1Q490_DOTSN|nr:hypothetical protein DOTSEDRAFT_20007 [Dothistroma septosporum NZE10]